MTTSAMEKRILALLPSLTRWEYVTLALTAADQAGLTVDRFRRIRAILEEDNAFGGNDPLGYNPILSPCDHEPPCAAPCAQVCSCCEGIRPLGSTEEPDESGWRDCQDCEAEWTAEKVRRRV